MKLLCLIPLLCLAAYCQCPSGPAYPSAVATDANLSVARNNVSTTLSAPMLSTDTSAVVVSTTGWAANMLGSVDNEIVFVTSVSGANVLNVTRACEGTTAAAHLQSATFANQQTAYSGSTSSKNEIKAIETALGPGLSNVPVSPIPNVASYPFLARPCNASLICIPSGSSGGALISGNNTLTFTPVPAGVNGTDANHRVWVSGGTGTAEACLITGGSGTAGQPSGQIIVQCANAHTGAWTVGTATGNIQEGIVGVGSALHLYVPAGTYTLNAAVQVPTGFALQGAGQGSTVLQVAAGQLARTAPWLNAGAPSGYYCEICVATGATGVSVRDLTLDENGSAQTYAYISGDIQGYQVTNSSFANVSVINRMKGGTGVGMAWYNGGGALSTNQNNVIQNATVVGLPGCTSPNGGGAYYIEGQNNRIVNTYAYGICDTGWVVYGNHNTVAEGHGDTGNGVESTPMFTLQGDYNTVANSHCASTNGGKVFACFEVGGPGLTSTGNIFMGDEATCNAGTSGGFEVMDVTYGAGTATDTTFSGITAQNCTVGLTLDIGTISKVTVSGAHLYGNTYAGIAITSPTNAQPAITDLTITGSVIDHNGYGIIAQSSQTALGVNWNISNNFIGDTSGSPIETYGVYLDVGTLTGATIKNNVITGQTTAPFHIGTTLVAALIGPNVSAFPMDGVSQASMGAPVASATSIAASGPVFHVTGTTAIATITATTEFTVLGGCVTLIPDGLWTTTTSGGNIGLASTAVVGKALTLCYDPGTAKFYPSY